MFYAIAVLQPGHSLHQKDLGNGCRIEGNIVTFFDILNAEWPLTLAAIESCAILAQPVHLMTNCQAFEFDLTSLVGCVLRPAFTYAIANRDQSDFLYPDLSLCEPRISATRTIEVTERLRGHVASVGDELVLSRELFDWIGGLTELENGVASKGTLTSWCRFLSPETRLVLPDRSFMERICLICQKPVVLSRGFWLADQRSVHQSDALIENSIGCGHYGTNKPFVLLKRRLTSLPVKFRSGGYFSPIFDLLSPIGAGLQSFVEAADDILPRPE